MTTPIGPAREIEEAHEITAWRGLARFAVVDPDAEQALLGLLERKANAPAAYLAANAHHIYRPPAHLLDMPEPPPQIV